MEMNKTFVAAMMALSMASVAHADQGHGKVTFTGSIIEAPCSINPDSTEQVIPLGQVSAKALANGGTSLPRPFQINLENCSLGTASTVTTTFSGAEGANGLLGMTGTAQGASIVITDGNGNIVTLGAASKGQKLQDGQNTLSFAAYLKGDNAKDAEGEAIAVVPGEFQSIADFTLAYQ